jgi:predicted dehydrogenase
MIVRQVDPVRVLVVAIGGYGYYYLQTLLEQVPPARAALSGVVDPEARQSRGWRWVEERGVPVFGEIGDFYASGHRADLAVIVSPIQHHVPQSCSALEHGSHVLCDKPLGATIQDAVRLMAVRDLSGRFVMIGYQWSFSAAIQALKRDILAGHFGRPLRFSTICCWPRDLAYYQRNTWAGRLRDIATGSWVLDGPMNNAMAHFLHNLLYLGGPAIPLSARPRTVEAELYRAYPIESCDTAACRVVAEDGLELLVYASHATEGAIEPRFRLEFERACVTFGQDSRTIVARDFSGQSKDYGAPDDTPQFKKLFDAIEAVREATPVVCGPEAASAQTLVVNGMHESMGEPVSFPDSIVRIDHGAGRRSVQGLGELLERCYERGALPADAGVEWSRRGTSVSLDGYDAFPQAASRVEVERTR